MAAAKTKQRFVTVEQVGGERIAIDLSKVEAVQFASAIPGVPLRIHGRKNLQVRLANTVVEVRGEDAYLVLGHLGIHDRALEEAEVV